MSQTPSFHDVTGRDPDNGDNEEQVCLVQYKLYKPSSSNESRDTLQPTCIKCTERLAMPDIVYFISSNKFKHIILRISGFNDPSDMFQTLTLRNFEPTHCIRNVCYY